VIETKTIPLMTPYIPPGTAEAVSDVLRSRWIGQGPKCEKFEQQFSDRIVGGRRCLAVGSCTDALHLAYLLSGIGPGDDVIAPLFTCTATNIPLLYCGARILFCDVEPNSLNMDPTHLKHLLMERKPKAIVAVHYGGAPVSRLIFDLAQEYDVPVIEDCAQALGAKGIAQRGYFACFSFQAVKHIGCGDGGMLVLPDHLKDVAKRIRWFGIDREAKLKGIWENDIKEIGFKYQLNDIAAAMGLQGLYHLDDQMQHRRRLRSAYMSGLSGVDGIRVVDTDRDSACWLLTVLVERREDFRKKLAEYGIESDQVHYRNDRYSIFANFRGEFPNMDAVDSKYLVLPLHMGMDGDDVRRICSVIKSGW
jgi:dTDP-4-amino-4,6-dideoxygalactose transaminase